jgi:hypothetical protein
MYAKKGHPALLEVNFRHGHWAQKMAHSSPFLSNELSTGPLAMAFGLVGTIDISQYRLLFGFFLLYMDRVPFELLNSAALP